MKMQQSFVRHSQDCPEDHICSFTVGGKLVPQERWEHAKEPGMKQLGPDESMLLCYSGIGTLNMHL
jgi:hypothetical protein